MKKRIVIASSIILLLVIVLSMYLLNGCHKIEELNELINSKTIGEVKNASISGELVGMAIDISTSNPIADAEISIGNKKIYTDAEGLFSYTIDNPPINNDLIVDFFKLGYFSETRKYSVDKLLSGQPLTIYSKKINHKYKITTEGGDIIDSLGNKIHFPKGFFNVDTEIYFEVGTNNSQLYEKNNIYSSFISFEIQPLTENYQGSYEIYLKIPENDSLPAGTKLKFYTYDKTAYSWQNNEEIFTISGDGRHIIGICNHFSINSLGMEVEHVYGGELTTVEIARTKVKSRSFHNDSKEVVTIKDRVNEGNSYFYYHMNIPALAGYGAWGLSLIQKAAISYGSSFLARLVSIPWGSHPLVEQIYMRVQPCQTEKFTVYKITEKVQISYIAFKIYIPWYDWISISIYDASVIYDRLEIQYENFPTTDVWCDKCNACKMPHHHSGTTIIWD
jgi:hypothetical protein